MKLDEEIKKALEKNKVPRGVVGLPEDGDRSVSYRFMGDVYEDTAFDLQQKSIVVRNMQEVGVNSVEAIKYLFPDKTEAERAEMLKGFSIPNGWSNTVGNAAIPGIIKSDVAVSASSCA